MLLQCISSVTKSHVLHSAIYGVRHEYKVCRGSDFWSIYLVEVRDKQIEHPFTKQEKNSYATNVGSQSANNNSSVILLDVARTSTRDPNQDHAQDIV